jgi:hypothetical protein
MNVEEQIRGIVDRAVRELASVIQAANKETFRARLNQVMGELESAAPMARAERPEAEAPLPKARKPMPFKPREEHQRPCPIPGCRGAAAGRYGGVCVLHKDMPEDEKLLVKAQARKPGGIWQVWNEAHPVQRGGWKPAKAKKANNKKKAA